MEQDLKAVPTRVPVEILGINAAGQESGNGLVVDGRNLPWLQDSDSVNAWGSWDVTWRDVVVLNAANKAVAVYNLTQHNLARQAARDSLMQILEQAAQDTTR